MFPLQDYKKAASVKNAVQLLAADPDARIISGGTDVLIRLRDGKPSYDRLVDIHGLAELKRCEMDDSGAIWIGSGVTFSQVMNADIIKEHLPHLCTAAGTVGGPQIRNVATIGGNICNGVTSADSASPLLVSNARLVIQGPDGTREVALSNFYTGPGKTVLQQNEVLVAFRINREDYSGYAGDYYKYAMREAMDIATIGCAVACRLEGDILADFRLAFGVASPTPIRCSKTEAAVRGNPVSETLLKSISDTVSEDVNPRTSWRASKEFRIHIIRELATRVTRSTIEKAGGKLS